MRREPTISLTSAAALAVALTLLLGEAPDAPGALPAATVEDPATPAAMSPTAPEATAPRAAEPASAAAPAETPEAPAERAAPRVPVDESLAGTVTAADLICETTCVAVRHRMSDAASPADALPLTFVTLRIDRVLWGYAPPDGTLTMRLLGGPAPDGRWMSVGGQIEFAVGDRDFLLMRRNHRGAASPCFGRFRRLRIEGDLVVSETGRRLTIAGDDLVPGERDPDVLRAIEARRTAGPGVHYSTATTEDGQPKPGDAAPSVGVAGMRALLQHLIAASAPARVTGLRRVRTSDFAGEHDLGPIGAAGVSTR